MALKRIMIVEDETSTQIILENILRKNGYYVEIADSWKKAFELLSLTDRVFDLILLDLGLPDGDGEDVLTQIRSHSNMPVIVVSANTRVSDRIKLLKEGADDYVVKPFYADELIARVETNLRKNEKTQEKKKKIIYLNLVWYPDDNVFYINSQALNFTRTESRIMELLITNPHRIFNKQSIYEKVWETDYVDDNALYAHIKRIRQKLKKEDPMNDYISTVPGLGYRMEA